ncbi:MAG: fumarate hydratase [Defluviitaleaceae bacterium]|nr:fumarate hydratase [Defluviitaleaceae bacterium]
MREIHIEKITEVVAELCIKACLIVDPKIRTHIENAVNTETGLAKQVLENMLQNQDIARTERLPICQDTGMAVVFVEIGQDVRIVGGLLADAINEGVRKGYEEGFLRKSVVSDPIHRTNTKDNTPAVIHYNIVSGDGFKITVSPKGFGSENMSQLKMLVPADGIEGIKDFVLKTVTEADSNPCPPIIVGIGIGGTFEYSAVMAKKALLRPLGQPNHDPYWAGIEQELLAEINSSGIGPAGLGGKTTAMAVHINTFATHIAGLPLAVNLGCHVNRHEEAKL